MKRLAATLVVIGIGHASGQVALRAPICVPGPTLEPTDYLLITTFAIRTAHFNVSSKLLQVPGLRS